MLELESELQQHAAALQRESLATGTLRRALAGKEQQLAHVSKEAQSLSEALEVTVDDAEKEREDLVRKLGEAEGLLEEERRESARLEDESARARDASAARVVELRARNTALAHHNAELKLKLEETMGENATAAAEARARIALLEEESGRWRREFTRAERAAAEARAEIAAFKEVNGRLKGELKEAQSVVPEALAQIEELERQLAARGAEVKELAEKVARLESRLAEKTGEVAEGRAQIAALQGEIARQKQEIEEWSQETEKAAADARAKIAALEDEVARAKRQSEESAGRGEKAAAAASDTIAALEAELAERTEEGERMREACVLLESELEEKKEAIDAHANERAIWESELAQKDKEIGTLAAKVGALEKEVLGWEAERAAWQTGGVGSPEKKAGEGAKKQVGSLAEAKLRTDLKRKEDARAALEKKVSRCGRPRSRLYDRKL